MRNISFLLILCTFLVNACKKYTVPEQYLEEPTDPLSELTVPDNFTWVTTEAFSPTIEFEGALAGEFLAIEILDQKFNKIQKYFKPSTEAVISIDQEISSQTDSAYIFCAKANLFVPFATSETNVKVGGNQIRPSFTSKLAGRTHSKSTCGAGNYDRIINSTSGEILIANKEDVCIQSNFTGRVTFQKEGSLTICGNVSLTQVNYWDNKKEAAIIVSEGGRLTASNFQNLNDESKTITNYGRVELSSNFNLNQGATVVNYGIWESSTLQINTDSRFENLDGATATFDGNLAVNKGDFLNAGSAVISGSLQVNSNGNLENYCSLSVSGNTDINKEITNFGQVSVSGNSTFNSDGIYHAADKSIWHTLNLTFNGADYYGGIEGEGIGVFVVSGNTTLNSIDIRNGFIDICDQNGIEINYWDENENTLLKQCETTVNTSECITEGLQGNQDPEGDDDNDGVPNGDDDDDSDPEVAGDFSYPSSGWAFRAFEDLWPSRGDYDFNDLVLKYKVEFFNSNSNNITRARVTVTIKAIGAGLINGIGIQFLERKDQGYEPYRGNLYESVSEGEYIDPADPSVVILANSVNEKIGPNKYKNDGEGPDGEPFTFTSTIEFNNGAGVKSNKVKPDIFLFRTNQRGLEIHLPGIPPTNAFDDSFIDTKEDNSSRAWFKTSENYPWGMEVHGVENFLHPLSKVSIIDAYENFGNWVNSNGDNHEDWFNNPNIPLCY